MDVQRCMDRCAVGTWRCAEVHRGMCRGVGEQVYRGTQMYVEVHGGVTEVHGGVYGGTRRWTEGCVEVDRECTEVMQWTGYMCRMFDHYLHSTYMNIRMEAS